MEWEANKKAEAKLMTQLTGAHRALWYVLGGAGLLAGIGGTAAAGSPLQPVFPKRQDIVAEFSSGSATADVTYKNDDSEAKMTSFQHGRLVLSSNDASCRPGGGEACRYTLVELAFEVNNFEVFDANVKDLRVRLRQPIPALVDSGGGLTIPSNAQFDVTGTVNIDGDDYKTYIGATPDGNSLTVSINLDQGLIGLSGDISGSEGDYDLELSIAATSNSPLANLPPSADAGEDQMIKTSCFASVQLDSSGTTDPDNDITRLTYYQREAAIGSGSAPVRFLPGEHRLHLKAEDEHFAADVDGVTITVEDNGETVAPPGATLISFQTPVGVDAALVASEYLKLADHVTVRGDGTKSTSVVNVGAAGSINTWLHVDSEVVGDVWSQPRVWIGERGAITGTLQTTATPEVQSGVSVTTNADATFEPLTTVSWAIPSASDTTHVGHIDSWMPTPRLEAGTTDTLT